jgi:hypothetical protein
MKENTHMRTIKQRFIPQPWQRRRAAYAGVLATVAYTIAMEGDMALTGNRFNDVRFIQGMIGGKEAQKSAFHSLPGLFICSMERF